VLVASSIALSALANVMVLPVWLKMTLLCLTGGVTVFYFTRHAVRRLFDGSIDGIAVSLEQRHPELKGRLIAAVQFVRSEQLPGYSQELIAVTEQQALDKAGLVNFNEVISYYPILKTGRLLIGSAILAFLMLVVFPGFFGYSYEVYSNPTTEIAPPLAYQVVPTPGSTEWVKYRDIEIGAAIFGQRIPSKARIHYRFVDGNWQNTEIDLGNILTAVSTEGDSLSVGLTLRQVNKSFDYFVEAGRIKSEIQKVDVVDRPRVSNIKLALFYPEYTSLEPQVIDENNGSFSAVIGSRVTMTVEANLPIQSAELVFDDSSRVPLSLTGKKGETSLTVDKSRAYYIRLHDHLGEKNPDPIEYYMTAVEDEYPSIDVLRPGFDANLTDEMLLPLKVRIYDDYGFSSLVLKYTVVSRGQQSEEHVAVLHFSERIKTEGDVEFNWDVDKMNLYPGDYLAYHFEIADNDQISGPKISRTRQYIARLPSLDEVIAQAEIQGKQRIVNTEELLKTGKDLVTRLKQASRKINSQARNSKKADWQQQKELENIAGQNEEMLKKLDKAAQDMQKSLEQLKENSLMSRQVMEKMQQIQKLFEEVATPEMKEAQRRLMEALKEMDRQQLQKAMKDYEMSQEELLKRLERTIALLKKLQLEQKMEAMLRKAEELVKQQDEMNKDTEKATKETLPQMSDREDQINKSLSKLKEEVEEYRELMKEAGMEKVEAAEEFAKAVEQTDAGKNMQQMSSSMQNQKKESALSEGKEALSKLSQMVGEMQEQQMAMQGGDSEAIKRAMRRAIDDANYLSGNQEDLLKEAATLDPRSLIMRDIATGQQDLLSASAGLRNQIAELGKESPFIAAELQKLVSDATSNMEMAVEGLGDLRGRQGINHQREAMVKLNKTSLRLMESLDQQKQCDKGGQCDKNLSQLESMCNKQNDLNKQTQKMCNNPTESQSGGKPQPGREGLRRLASEQGAIRKSLDELADEFAGSRQILGRLDDISREMKEVEEDLAEGTVGPETTERQLRIFSRMLEASRSLQRKDFTEQRQATTTESQMFQVPAPLPAGLLDDRTNIEDRLRKFLDDSYPPQYEEQIKAYFRALLKAEGQSASGASN
jgi:hypothetical protein